MARKDPEEARTIRNTTRVRVGAEMARGERGSLLT